MGTGDHNRHLPMSESHYLGTDLKLRWLGLFNRITSPPLIVCGKNVTLSTISTLMCALTTLETFIQDDLWFIT